MLDDFYRPFLHQLEHARDYMPDTPVEQPVGRDCPQCGASQSLVRRLGRFGMFIACNRFPDCSYRESLGMGIPCPQCGRESGGELTERRTRNGRTFYGCVRYPECDFSSWKRPLRQPCPACGHVLLEDRRNTARCTQCGLTIGQDALNQPDRAEA